MVRFYVVHKVTSDMFLSWSSLGVQVGVAVGVGVGAHVGFGVAVGVGRRSISVCKLA